MIDSFSGKNSFLSNFHPCHVEFDGMLYPSVEHAYQAGKSLDFAVRKAFTWDELTAAQSKRLGRAIACRSDWDSAKDQVMLTCLRSKFLAPNLRELLVDTGHQDLIEGNRWGDTYWGVCRGEGLNRLGKLLMRVRKELNV